MKTKKELWSEKSKTFPVYDESDIEDMNFINKVIGIALGKGPSINGKSVIDIGCGTGRHTFNLAKTAKTVYGTDISKAMVEVLDGTGKKYGFTNVTAGVCDWKEADAVKNGWAKNFDIAWAAMTGAINSPEDILKMNLCAREWCVCVAWGRRRENEVLSEVFAAHSAELKLPPGEAEVTKALDELGFEYAIDHVENFWSFEGTKEEAAADLAWHLKMSEVVPLPEKIDGILEKYKNNGIYGHSTKMEMSVIVWKARP